ncbi:hypothetical protein ONE63_010871 [Megalurothrips usitatus]|uniref:NADH dehydrogenase [ubiquinone] 1 beta subcomplex subunit 6 n=1 Tax=Megalurothrips usitatus TaxID=439358 RepID=A0AAV7XIH4_9NEOP|nr:hypothetical protein ONE63_010871 [Megalurothrips usitatus]
MEYENKDKPHSTTGGVKAFPIEGRFAHVRERLAGGFTDEDRAYRAKFLKDQVLHNEPVVPDWWYKERFNPIRRFYRWPLDTLICNTETPQTFWRYASRYWTGKVLLGLAGTYVGYYIIKYHSNDWQNCSGFEYIRSKEFKPIGHPEYNKPEFLKPADYYDNRMGVNKFSG